MSCVSPVWRPRFQYKLPDRGRRSCYESPANDAQCKHSFYRFASIKISLLVTVIMVGSASYAKNLRSAHNAIEDASVVDRDVLFGDDLDYFLRDHTPRECRDVVQFSSFCTRNLFGDLSYACIGRGIRDIPSDGGKNIRRIRSWCMRGGTQSKVDWKQGWREGKLFVLKFLACSLR